MKKIFLTAMALLTMASASVFGMYGVDSGWIDFLVHGNQFRARMQQLGFVLGNDTIRGTFGFNNAARGAYGSLLQVGNDTTADGSTVGSGFFYDFQPTISMGIGYTSSLISVGVGYNATIGTNRWVKYNNKTEGKTTEAVVHTPVLTLTALDNAFRMAIPIQVLNLTDKLDGWGKGSATAVSLEAQFRYYTGLDFLPQIRLYLKYGTYGAQFTPEGGEKQKEKIAESFGFDFRIYFGATVEEVALTPFIKLAYNGALGKQHNQTAVTAVGVLHDAPGLMGGAFATSYTNTAWGQSAWNLQLMPALGLAANSDVVSLYLEPSLGLKVTQSGSATDKNVKEVYDLGYAVYGEIYIRPIQSLEWYFEASIGNVQENSGGKGLAFAGSTGITWYLPAL